MSITKITYSDQFHNGIIIISDPLIEIFQFNDYIEVTQFLENLKQDKVYVVTFSLVLSFIDGDEENPSIILSKPILICKNSNARIITNFLKNRIQIACNLYYLDESMIIDDEIFAVVVKHKEINLF